MAIALPTETALLTLTTPQAFGAHVGQEIGPTGWRSVSQADICAFAELTGDDHWIHVDVERAARENPGGRTIVHGLYLLSLIPRWQRLLFTIERRGAGLLYGYDGVRFLQPVAVDTSIRLRQTVRAAAPHRQGTRISLTSVIETNASDRPALVAETILLIGDA